MINNRQSSNSSSRRRGRGGSSQGRPSGGSSSGQRDSGNRIDSRARGNALQLLEKFKNMARDAQMSGDRVQVEYYLQFADHYFRVLADSRARSDDHRPIRPVDDFDGSDEEYGDEGEPIRAGEQGDGRQPQQQSYGQNGRDGQQQPQYQQNARDGQQPRRDDARRDEGRNEDARRDDGRRDDNRRDDARGNDNRGNESRSNESRRDDSRRDDTRGNDIRGNDSRRDERPRGDYPPREQVRGDAGAREARVAEQPPQANSHEHREDYRERVANDLDPAAPLAGEAKSSSRRPSRTRKPAPVEVAADAPVIDADRLPPSLGIAAPLVDEQPTEVIEGEAKPKRRRRTSSATSGEAQV